MNWYPEKLRWLAGVALAVLLSVLVWWQAANIFDPAVETFEQHNIALVFASKPEPPAGADPTLTALHAATRQSCGFANADALRRVVADMALDRVLDYLKVSGPFTVADLHDLIGKPVAAGQNPEAEKCAALLLIYRHHFPAAWVWLVASPEGAKLDRVVSAQRARLGLNPPP